MQVSELANRYARAILDLVGQAKSEQILAELRGLQTIFEKDAGIREFLFSPLVKAKDRAQALTAALKSAGLSPETSAFVMLLSDKGRLPVFSKIVEAIKIQNDMAHGVTRGSVRSAAVLSPEERKSIEEIVSSYTQKQVILTYKEDTSVIGGLIAEVGSFTFDDTLTSHLRRLKEEMTRRIQ
ncbi:MAG: ATP synthase F1 subunit delta [Bdellovibrionales bacterium]